MPSPSRTQIKRKNLSIKDLAISIAIAFVILAPPAWCWYATKFPPQIFGNKEDHFRGHVISPIPESVEVLNVQFDDLIIHPDVVYYFRFVVNRDDLEKIISYRSLVLTNGECSGSSYPPEWWNNLPSDDMEVYEYNGSHELIITLCYDISTQTAYYMFLTY
jgi:hypothetical protein